MALTRRLSATEGRLVFWGACGLLVIAIVWRIASNLEFTDSHYIEFSFPLWLRRATSFTHDGTLTVALLVLVWWLAEAKRGRPGLVLLAALGAAACVVLFPTTSAQWTRREFPQRQVAQFAAWRERIPPGTDVFWLESPLAVWMLLDRPSYLSVLQSAGVVFSREAALELKRRALALSTIVPPDSFLNWDGQAASFGFSVKQLQGLCQLAAFEFLVTRADLGVAPAGFIPSESPPGSKGLRLYHCPLHPNG